MKLCLLFAAIALAGCPKPTPEPVTPPDADAAPPGPQPPSDGSPAPPGGVQGACRVLQGFSCPEAAHGIEECSKALQGAIDSKSSKKVTDATVGCVAGSTSVELVRACPGGWCPSVGY